MPDDRIGEIVHASLEENVIIESAPWAVERVDRVLRRLHAARDDNAKQFVVVIPWIEEFTAFTTPGRYIFFTRRLFQLCDCDEMAAMIIAHEMAHHDLGHLDVFPDWLRNVAPSEIRILLFALYRIVEMRIYSPEMESDADRYALELCVRAGYDGRKCIGIFDKLEKMSLDMGDIDGAYGPDEALEKPAETLTWSEKISVWLHQRQRGYLSVRERRDALIEQLERMTGSEAPV